MIFIPTTLAYARRITTDSSGLIRDKDIAFVQIGNNFCATLTKYLLRLIVSLSKTSELLQRIVVAICL